MDSWNNEYNENKCVKLYSNFVLSLGKNAPGYIRTRTCTYTHVRLHRLFLLFCLTWFGLYRMFWSMPSGQRRTKQKYLYMYNRRKTSIIIKVKWIQTTDNTKINIFYNGMRACVWVPAWVAMYVYVSATQSSNLSIEFEVKKAKWGNSSFIMCKWESAKDHMQFLSCEISRLCCLCHTFYKSMAYK